VRFVVDKVAMRQIFHRVLRFSSVNIIPPQLSMLIHLLGDQQETRWWPQIRDIVSHNRNEQQTLSVVATVGLQAVVVL
jgi:hypothetical protein